MPVQKLISHRLDGFREEVADLARDGCQFRKARDGEVVVIDVRARTEYEQAHLPFARSMPLAELEQRIAELPKRKQIVAYCRGPYCLLSDQAVALLQARGFCVRKTPDGISEWQAAGLPVQGNSPLQHGGRS